MSTIEPNVERGTGVRWGYVVAAAVVLIFLWLGISVVGLFRLSSDTAALRQSVMSGIGGSWDKKIALRAGFLTTGFIRIGSKALKLEPEPRAAIESLRGAEVGVYELQEKPASIDHAEILRSVDKVMSARGWERVVGVSKDGKLVAMFSPRATGSAGILKVCVLVLDGPKLVVVSGKGDVTPLFNLAMKRIMAERRI